MPMTQGVWLALGFAGLLTAAGSIYGRFNDQPELQLAGVGLAAVIWPVWAINAFSVAIVTDSGTTVVQSNPALGYLGGILAILVILDLLFAVLSLADHDAGPRYDL